MIFAKLKYLLIFKAATSVAAEAAPHLSHAISLGLRPSTISSRRALSPASHYHQLVEEALRLPRAARASRRAALHMELSALAAADAVEEEGEMGAEENDDDE